MKQIRADCSQIDIADIKGTLLFFFVLYFVRMQSVVNTTFQELIASYCL